MDYIRFLNLDLWVLDLGFSVAAALDQLDFAIIGALQADPRASAVQLGQVAGCLPNAANARLKRLLDNETIRVLGYIHPGAVGAQAEAIVLFRSADPGVVVRDLVTVPGVQFATVLFSEWDGMCSVVEHDGLALSNLVDTSLRSRDDVRDISVQRVVENLITGINVADPVSIRDEQDHALALLLAANARESFANLAEASGMKEPTARSRALRLLEGGAVQPMVIPDGAILGLDTVAAFAIQTSGSAHSVLEKLAAIPGVLIRSSVQGQFDVACEVITAGLTGLSAIRTQIWSIPGVRSVTTHIYGERIPGTIPIPKPAT